MRVRDGWPLMLLLALVVACAAERAPEVKAPGGPPTTATVSTPPTPGAKTTPQLAPPIRLDVRASRLAIPSLGIDAPVQLSQVIPDTSPPTPGCPASSEGGETLSVPDQGIATPEGDLEGLENKAWIFGHSRWQNQPGQFFSLQDINVGDEVFLDGIERTTGAQITTQRFVVDALYLTDIDSGTKLVIAEGPADIPTRPVVFLQASVREDGPNKQWLLDREKVLAKSRNLIEGDPNDPCKYLLLFARAS